VLNTLIDWTIFLFVAAWVAVLSFTVCAPAVTSGVPDYCYIETIDENSSALMMHRPWRKDGIVQRTKSAKEAAEAAAAIGCRLLEGK
jgi:hypothetical protein